MRDLLLSPELQRAVQAATRRGRTELLDIGPGKLLFVKPGSRPRVVSAMDAGKYRKPAAPLELVAQKIEAASSTEDDARTRKALVEVAHDDAVAKEPPAIGVDGLPVEPVPATPAGLELEREVLDVELLACRHPDCRACNGAGYLMVGVPDAGGKPKRTPRICRCALQTFETLCGNRFLWHPTTQRFYWLRHRAPPLPPVTRSPFAPALEEA